MVKATILLSAAMVMIGCATTVPLPMQNVVTLSTGDVIDYVTVDGKDHSGVMTRVVDRYLRQDGKVVLIAKDGFSGPGLGNTFMTGGFAGLAQGAGFVGGMALLRPSNVNQSGGGASQSQDANVDANATASAQQTQGQVQGQVQGQTSTNINTNANRNTNISKVRGGWRPGPGGGNSGTKPGHGYGNKNHGHTGPPGQNKK